MKTEIIDWTGVEAPTDFALPVWIDLLTSVETTGIHPGALRPDLTLDQHRSTMLRVKISRARLAQTAPAFPGYASQKPEKRRGAVKRPGKGGGKNADKVAPGDDTGTPQTRKKLKADQVDALYRRGTLDLVHVAAAERIATVREALGQGLTPGAVQIGERVQGGGLFRDPLQRMSQTEGRWWLDEYRPWLVDLVSDPIERVTATKRQVFNCAVGFTMAVVIENWCVADAEDYCRIPRNHGLGTVLLRIALDRYALIAGLRSGAKASETAAFAKAS
ncbi:hypothetical protein [Parvibaculum sp.]|uniref:hypothetical protein n=1 Tax=Parvibaculum sp. TaxID=2024848 RepID=UPI002732861F|nr:hypothetical protein [Parvibaculum sp.]MDP3327851.1 hypothetical protein [Parvibaculum sp.]